MSAAGAASEIEVNAKPKKKKKKATSAILFLPSSSSLGTSGPTPEVDQEAASFSSRSGGC